MSVCRVRRGIITLPSYSYEGYNKVIKKIAKGSNFKNICKRVADIW